MLKPPSTSARIKKLRKIGIIKAVVPMFDPEKLGFNTTAWITVRTEIKADCCEVANVIAKIQDILEIHEIIGQFDIFIKVKVHDNIDLHNIAERVARFPGVSGAFSMVSV